MAYVLVDRPSRRNSSVDLVYVDSNPPMSRMGRRTLERILSDGPGT